MFHFTCVYLGSISDPELTKVSGFLGPGVSIMADRGFTIKDLPKGGKGGVPPLPFTKPIITKGTPQMK